MNEVISRQVEVNYKKLFGGEPIIVRSPGRVNIIGEHTDYNNGFVLPAAIDKAAYVAVGKRSDGLVSLYSNDFTEKFEIPLKELKPTEKGWPNYILGIADQLIKRGYLISGFNLVLGADVPIGSGMSSSAAIECSTVFALSRLFDLNIPKIDMVLIAQKAEHEFPKVMCGIMDQFASMFGKNNHVIKLDCLTLNYEYVPFKMEGIKILLLNTNVDHSLASSEYNVRRQQCEKGVKLVQEYFPEVSSLRDINIEMLNKYVRESDPLVYKRCKYVIDENLRLLQGCEDLKNNDISALGKKMFQSHDGLSTEYEVSCKELDFLVDCVRNMPEKVLGARMMGGGFGGCTINLVKGEVIEELVNNLSISYEKNIGRKLTPYVAVIEDGTCSIV